MTCSTILYKLICSGVIRRESTGDRSLLSSLGLECSSDSGNPPSRLDFCLGATNKQDQRLSSKSLRPLSSHKFARFAVVPRSINGAGPIHLNSSQHSHAYAYSSCN